MKVIDIITETMSGSIATATTGLGSDKDESFRSVYANKPKKEKNTIIRRIPKNE